MKKDISQWKRCENMIFCGGEATDMLTGGSEKENPFSAPHQYLLEISDPFSGCLTGSPLRIIVEGHAQPQQMSSADFYRLIPLAT